MVNKFSLESLLQMRGQPVVDSAGREVGSIEDVYVDNATRVPEWVAVSASFYGGKRMLVPLADAEAAPGMLRVPFDKQTIDESPSYDRREIDEEAERELYEHYGIPYSEHASPSVLPEGVETSAEEGSVATHTAARWPWPDAAPTGPSGSASQLASESAADAPGVGIAPETMAAVPTVEPEVAPAPERAPQSEATTGGRSEPQLRSGERLDEAPVVMTDMPADVPGTLYDTSGASRAEERHRFPVVAGGALAAAAAVAGGALLFRRSRRRRG